MSAEAKVYETLENLGIPYEKIEHPPVYTVEEANEYWAKLEGTHTKNLFFRNKKGNRHFLVILDSGKKLDIKSLQSKIGAGTLSFASDRRLSEHLGLSKGAVSVFGLINDEEGKVEVIVEKKLLDGKRIGFHPNANTATLTVSVDDFKKFLQSRGNKITYKDL